MQYMIRLNQVKDSTKSSKGFDQVKYTIQPSQVYDSSKSGKGFDNAGK